MNEQPRSNDRLRPKRRQLNRSALAGLLEDGRRRRWVAGLAVCILALVARAILLLELSENSPSFDNVQAGDSLFYDRVAAGLPAPQRAFFHSPLYGRFLTSVYSVFGRNLLAARAMQLLLGVVSTLLVYLVTLRLFRRVSTATLAGLMAGLFGPALLYESQLLVDGLIPLLAFLVLLLLLDGVRPGEPRRPSALAIVGVAIGLAALARPVMLAWLLVLMAWLSTCKDYPWRDRRRHVLAMLAGTAVVIAPVTLRNYLVEGDFVLITANGGLNLFIGNNAQANGSYAAPQGMWFRPGDPLSDFAGRKLGAQALGHEPSSSELSRWWASRAWDYIAAHPAQTLSLALQKLRILVNDYEYPQMYNYYVYRELAPVLRPLPTAGFIVAPGMVGVAAMWLGHHGRKRRLIAALTIVFALAFVPFFVTGRYRLAWIILLAPFAAWVAITILRSLRNRRHKRALQLSLAVAASAALTLWPLERHPSLSNQHLTFANAAMQSGNTRAAVQWSERATRASPTFAMAWAMHGKSLRLDGRSEEAATILSTAAESLSKSADIQRELGAAHLDLHEANAAADALERCIDLAPADPEAWLLLGRSLEELGCGPRALDAYRTVSIFQGSPEHRQAARERSQMIRDRLGSQAELATTANCRRQRQERPRRAK